MLENQSKTTNSTEFKTSRGNRSVFKFIFIQRVKVFSDQLVKLVTPPAPMESKTIPSALNGYWITYTEYYTDRYWDQHPSQGFTDA